MTTRLLPLLTGLSLLVAQAPSRDMEPALARFFTAPSPAEAARVGAALIEDGADFATLYERLRQGSYPADAETGPLLLEHVVNGSTHPYLVVVPEDYDAKRRYPVRVYLHGGVARPKRDAPEGTEGGWWRNPLRVAADDHIAVFPYSWQESLWWQDSQADSLTGILWRLRRTYNVDENRVYLFGVSDGGTGAWFFGFRATTPWAGFLPFIAHPAVLSNPASGVAGELYPINLTNKPFYVVNGGRDRLYPAAAVMPYMTLFRDAGVDLTFVSKPESGHGTGWWPDETHAIEAFIEAHPRDPLPDRVVWRTDSVDRYRRAHWLLIDEIVADDSELVEPNAIIVRGRQYLAFPRGRVSGQLTLRRTGNQVDATAWGIGRFTLLLAPSEFDLAEPIVVRVNDEEAFRGRVERSAEVLLKWAARDADRSMLFAAELSIDVDSR